MNAFKTNPFITAAPAAALMAVPAFAETPGQVEASAWQGRYMWKEPLGRIGGSSPAENVGGRHAVGDRLLTLTRDGGGDTRLEGLSPASDATPRAKHFFKKVG